MKKAIKVIEVSEEREGKKVKEVFRVQKLLPLKYSNKRSIISLQ